jgi:signal peptidase I
MTAIIQPPSAAPDAAGQDDPVRAAGTEPAASPVPSRRARLADRGRFGLLLVARSSLIVVATWLVIALLPILFGWRPLLILTGSMEPAVSPGDVVLVSTLPDGIDYEPGMVVAFDTVDVEGEPIVKVHRITGPDGDGFVTRGDANASPDSGVRSREDIVGAARLLVPFIGLPVVWLREDPAALAAWFALTIAAVLLALPPAERRKTRRSRRSISRIANGAGAVGAVVALAVVVGAVSPSAHAYAAFTSRTDTRATFGTAAVPAITAGRAASYSLLAAGSVSDSLLQVSSVAGDIGTSPGTTISGFTVFEHWGAVERNTAAARNAMIDAKALGAALSAQRTTTRSGTLTGRIAPGVYSAPAFTTSGTVRLDAGGDGSARFVFVASSLSVASGTNIILAGGASAANVYWRISGTANLANSTTLQGTLVANGNVTIGNASVTGRIFSLNGNITANRITTIEP